MTSRFDDSADLSTLTNLRLNNRRAKQRLVKEFLDETKHSRKGGHGMTTDLLDDLHTDFMDESTISPFKATRRHSPSRRSLDDSRTAKHPLVGAHTKHDLDTSLLDDDNLRYLDENTFQRDARLNKEKREKFIRSVVSSPDWKSKGGYESGKSARVNRYDDSPKKSAPIGFRPREIPNLKPNRPGDVDVESPLNSRRRYKVSSNRNFASGTKRSEHDPQLANELDFEQLIKKYNLKNETEYTIENAKSGYDYDTKALREQVKEMEDRLEQYQRELANSKSSMYKNEELYKKNLSLASEIKKLNQFIKFMDANFNDMYLKWKADKEEKEQLQALVNSMKGLDLGSPMKKWKAVHAVKPLHTRSEDSENTEQLLNLDFK